MFTQLSCYAPHEVDTDEKKQECFLNGLNDRLTYVLEARDVENFQGMVNRAHVLENRRGVMECKHKLVRLQTIMTFTSELQIMHSIYPF
jgi:hypothetical protein